MYTYHDGQLVCQRTVDILVNITAPDTLSHNCSWTVVWRKNKIPAMVWYYTLCNWNYREFGEHLVQEKKEPQNDCNLKLYISKRQASF